MSLNKQEEAGLLQASMVPAAVALEAPKRKISFGTGAKLHDVKYNSEIASRQNSKLLGYSAAKKLNFEDSEIGSWQPPVKHGLKTLPFPQKSSHPHQPSNPQVHMPAASPDTVSEKNTRNSLNKAKFQDSLRPLTFKPAHSSSLASSFHKISLLDDFPIQEVDSAGTQPKQATHKWPVDKDKHLAKDTVYKSFLMHQQLFQKSDFSKNQPTSKEAIRNSNKKSSQLHPDRPNQFKEDYSNQASKPGDMEEECLSAGFSKKEIATREDSFKAPGALKSLFSQNYAVQETVKRLNTYDANSMDIEDAEDIYNSRTAKPDSRLRNSNNVQLISEFDQKLSEDGFIVDTPQTPKKKSPDSDGKPRSPKTSTASWNRTSTTPI